MVASTTQLREAQQSHQQLRGQVSEMILLSHSPQHDAEVLPQFLRRMVDTVYGRSGTIWSIADNRELACVCEYQAPGTTAAALAPLRPSKKVIHDCAMSAAGEIVMNASPAELRTGTTAQHAHATILVPIHQNGVVWGAIELHPAADANEKSQREVLTFVRHMARVLSHRAAMHSGLRNPVVVVSERIAPESFEQARVQQPVRRSPPSLPKAAQPASKAPQSSTASKTAQETKYFEVLLALHESLDVEATAFVIANEFRQLLRCDRVSVAVTRGTVCRIVAVSGQDAINRRADVVRQLETLAQVARSEQAAVWLRRESGEVPPHFAEQVEAYRELSAWQQLGIIPLRSESASATTSPAIAVLIVERMSETQVIDMPEVTGQFAPHAALALRNASEQEQLFLLSVWKKLGRARHLLVSTSRRKLGTIAATFIAGISFLTFFPVAFHVQGSGALQPVAQQDVFAEVEGVVTAIHVEHGDVVKQGDILLELRNTDLEVQIADTLGQRRSAQEQLASIQRMRHVEKITREEETRLAGQMMQLQEQLKGLDQQHRLLQMKKERLVVRSPMAGHVSSWNVQRQLMHRPVAAGQILLTIAESDGPWNLEVYLPEAEAGHLLAAGNAAGQRVDYLVTSQPTVTYAGEVTHVDDTAQMYDEFGHAVRVLVKVDKQEIPETPAGTTATARILCGQKSIGYVWLHRLFDFIHTRILFPLF